MRFPLVAFVLVLGMWFAFPLTAQSPNGTINGLVLDPSDRAITGANVLVISDSTGLRYAATTNDEGIYSLPSLPPGPYRLQVSKIGFKTLVKPDIVLNVQDALSVNFTLPVGATLETVTVEGGAPMVNTESAAVSTVVDRQFAENLPLNGRSFQTLIQLTPGVVSTPSNPQDGGQFSINGQRGSSNYWMVDGVSANVGSGTSSMPGNGVNGSLGGFSVLGGTNSLVSVDALQEFRIQTSTFAPEFGRTPGGQISIATRSGTDQLHGTAFDYLRNDVLDANNWFNGYLNDPPLPKAEERQNDFGGTFSGPLVKDKTFFFLSVESLRLRLPQTSLTTVPDLGARESATTELQPFLNAYPLPNGPDDPDTGTAQFNSSYSNPASLDAYSLRIDGKVNNSLSLFGRYNYSPSDLVQRGGGTALSTTFQSDITLQTGTIGAILAISPRMNNDLRFNYSRTDGSSEYVLDTFGGAVPLTTLPLPSGFSRQNGFFQFNILSLTSGRALPAGLNAHNLQRQINVVDNLSFQHGAHTIKVGVDFRRLSPLTAPPSYRQGAYFDSVQSAAQGESFFGFVFSNTPVTLLFRNLSFFAQDTWRIKPRLTLTYGLRLDFDFAPSSLKGPAIPAVTGYSLTDFSNIAVAQAGTPPFETTSRNFAPRLGAAYQLSQSQDWQTVLRGGFGVFYDLVSSEAGNAISFGFPPFQANNFTLSGSFPYSSDQIAPVPIPSTGTITSLYAFNPRLQLPYTLQWTLALEQAFGRQQTFTASYVGAAGRRLLQTSNIISPPSNPDMMGLLVDNTARSDYDALQGQFKRRLSRGLQLLASYTWSHSIDDGSAGSAALTSNKGVPGSDPRVNRGPSDFDTRHSFSTGLSVDMPEVRGSSLARAILAGWSTDTFVLAHTAPPVDVVDDKFGNSNLSGAIRAEIRPDIVSGENLYLFDSQYPGGKALNLAAFQDPPTQDGIPVRQGNLGRNALRGFGTWQWDFAVHRDFPIFDRLKLQFRAEIFNILNHPNFGPPASSFDLPGFGVSNQLLGQYLGENNLGGGGFSSLYQTGGPRSMQFALKLSF